MPKCAVAGCQSDATAEVILYDVYHDGSVLFQRDETCPYICAKHLVQNEAEAAGVREPRGIVEYPHSNRHGAQGFTIYKPL